MNRNSATDQAVLAATLVAVAMIAQQVGGKAVRDALFLSNYDVASLPNVVIGAALFSIAWIAPVTHWMTRYGPGRVVPAGFLVSALLLLIEGLLSSRLPRLVAVAFYFHMAALAPVLISGFWSLVNERFDPTTARRRVGRITAGATLGGLVGGLLAERIGAWSSLSVIFPALAVLHLFCAWQVRGLILPASASASGSTSTNADVATMSGLRVLRRNAYLRNLALLTLLGALAAGLLDFVFKAQATAAFEGADHQTRLLRFFAIFYTAVGLLTFVVQALLGQRSLEKLGLARTAAFLPGLVAGGGLIALFAPGLAVLSALRGSESIVRSSIYRSGYELLYTPLPAAEKRSTKTLVDVGFDRLGDVAAGGLVKLGLATVRSGLVTILVFGAVAVAFLALWTTFRLGRQYVRVLERSLMARAVHLEPTGVRDSTTRNILQTIGNLAPIKLDRSDREEQDTPEIAAVVPRSQRGSAPTSSEAGGAGTETGGGRAQTHPLSQEAEHLAACLTALQSGDLKRIEATLQAEEPTPALVAQVLPLLAWDAASESAIRWLARAVPAHTGQILDALLDTQQEFAIRRRIPRIFGMKPTERAIEGLHQGLEDRRFEVRLQCGRALAIIHKRMPEHRWSREKVFEVVRRELRVEKPIWKGRRLLDRDDPTAQELGLVDTALSARCDRSLEHVFTLLSLTFEPEPLRIAFRGLHTDDEMLRGTALEYLDTLLPADMRAALGILLDEAAPRRKRAPSTKRTEDVVQALLQSHESILINLEELRKAGGLSGKPGVGTIHLRKRNPRVGIYLISSPGAS